MAERDEVLYLTDLLGAIDKILTYTAEGQGQFLGDSKTQDAVVRNLEVIGEAVRGVSPRNSGCPPGGSLAEDRGHAGPDHSRLLQRQPEGRLGHRQERPARPA